MKFIKAMLPGIFAAVITFAVCFAGGCAFATLCYASLNSTSARTLRTASGGVMGYVDSGSGKVAVRNSSRKTIGYVDDNGTYNANRKKIAGSRLPGYLFCR